MTPDLIAGRYRVVRAVGRGGMGTVWLCRDEVLGREVAVKQVGAFPGESATDTARALREARSSAALNHRNVVSVFDIVDTDDGRAWLVMEYVPSRTLAEIVRQDGPLEPARAAHIGAQVAAGLAAAHAAGTIHRDVKPGNILVSDGDVAKISDFGIARGAEDDQLTRTGLVTGTPSYFSPELARGDDPGPESDVYALGATLYTAVEGRGPYPDQRNAIALLQKIAAEPPAAPTQAGPLAGPISRMMDRDPRSRWTMTDAVQALSRLTGRADDGADHTTVLPAAFVGAAGAGAAAGAASPSGVDKTASATPGADATAASPAPGSSGAAEDPSPAVTPAARAGRTADDGDDRRGIVWIVAAAVLVVLGLGAGLMMLGNDGEAPTAAAPESPSPTEKSSPSTSPTPKPSPTRTSAPSPEPSETRRAQQPAQRGDRGQAMENDVQEYFSFMPDNTDAGWQRLAPSMKSQGRGSYEDWWDSIESVDLHSTDAVAGQPQVDIDLTYVFEDGRVVRETQRLTLESSDEGYLIADDEVLSSRTVS